LTDRHSRTHQAMREMVTVTDPDRPSFAPAPDNYPGGVIERNCHDDQRRYDADRPLAVFRIKERGQNREDGYEIADDRAPGVAEINRRRLKIERQKPEQCTGQKQATTRNKDLS